jgi:hypothetical protein
MLLEQRIEFCACFRVSALARDAGCARARKVREYPMGTNWRFQEYLVIENQQSLRVPLLTAKSEKGYGGSQRYPRANVGSG